MNIAILGYGKMGKTIEKIAIDRGHTIVCRLDNTPKKEDLAKADCAIEFSVPEAAFANLKACFKNAVPAVSGTTGWLDNYEEATKLCEENETGFIYASNFSLGVNLFFHLNKQLAKMMKNFEQYNPSIEETHHTQKADRPSGTAISLAEDIMAENNLKNWKLYEKMPQKTEENLPVVAKREPDVFGVHTVAYHSQLDTIEIKHEAHSREGFALGAVIAAEYLKDKKGIYTMKDVLGLQEL